MSRAKLSSPLLLLLLAACGGNVVVDGLSGASATGAGGSATTGAGGALGTSVGAGTVLVTTGAGGSQGVTTATTGVGGGAITGCAGGDGIILLTAGTENFKLTSSCTSQSPPLPVPLGWELKGGASNSLGTLNIEGCVDSATNSPGLVIHAPGANALGEFKISSVEFFGVALSGPLVGSIQVNSFGPVGGVIAGIFEFTQGQTYVAGNISVCRAPDIYAP